MNDVTGHAIEILFEFKGNLYGGFSIESLAVLPEGVRLRQADMNALQNNMDTALDQSQISDCLQR